MEPLYRQLVSTFEEVLPLLGLVLFGDPKVARRFYRESFAMAMDRLASAWEDVEDRQGIAVESTDLAVRAVMGIALMVAIESHHSTRFDRERAIELMAELHSRLWSPLEPFLQLEKPQRCNRHSAKRRCDQSFHPRS